MEFKREKYLQQLISGIDSPLIKVITGIRRSGKSYLLFTLFDRYLKEIGVPEDHIIKIALDDMEVCFIVHMGWRNSSASMRQLYCSSLWFWDSSYITFDGENEID